MDLVCTVTVAEAAVVKGKVTAAAGAVFWISNRRLSMECRSMLSPKHCSPGLHCMGFPCLWVLLLVCVGIEDGLG